MGILDKLVKVIRGKGHEVADEVNVHVANISGKAVEDKVREYSEIYGEVLLGLHRDLENQNRLLQGCEQRLGSQMQLFKEQMTALAGRVDDLESRFERIQVEIAARFDSFLSTIDQFESETSAPAVAGRACLGLAQDLNKENISLENRLATEAKQVQQLRFYVFLSYVFALGLGVVIWLIR